MKLNITLELTISEGGYYPGLEEDLIDDLMENVPLQSYLKDNNGDEVIVDIEDVSLTNKITQ